MTATGAEKKNSRNCKVPDVLLGPDLLRRTWDAPDWKDHGAVLRRFLPRFARALVSGLVEPVSGMDEVGRSFVRGHRRQWPAHRSAAVWEFLHAWWAHTLTEPDPAVPTHEVLALCTEASATFSPWLDTWEELGHRVAGRHLAEAAAHWEHDLLGDQELLHRIRLVGLTGPARWEDPHRPHHRC
ncbi:hypothetical protein [Streptomyces sp. NBC_01754]|uniref:hypothetical protein n=1 Tax=Streptomyces sp. NBC_01754 TaxID=2975930 RepID=UPI002DD8D345|nr:hypothetical protein [Streptomyces sp. NBC_01754]